MVLLHEAGCAVKETVVKVKTEPTSVWNLSFCLCPSLIPSLSVPLLPEPYIYFSLSVNGLLNPCENESRLATCIIYPL